MITNEEIADKCIDCENCKHLHKNDYNLHKQNCINCGKFIEKALTIKDNQIKEAISTFNNVLNYYQNLPTSTKTLYMKNFAAIQEAMNLLKQKLNLED